MRPTLALVAASSLMVAATACNGQEASNAEAENRAARGAPVESRPANNPDQRPAFEGQTRAPGVTTQAAYTVSPMAEGLDHPWALQQLPSGHWLVTERSGALRLFSADGADLGAVSGVPAVHAERQGGLLDVALSPDFATDRLVYFSYAEDRADGNGTTVARARLSGDERSLSGTQVIFRAWPSYSNSMHYGSRLAFDREGRLYITLGERSDLETRPQAQDLGSHLGKIIRINADGSIPADNPYVGREGARPEIWSLGHRNVQGAALNPWTGELWAMEHGARGGDEVNIVRGGLNYGWPTIAYGMEYRGGAIGEGLTAREGLEQPVYYWDPVIAAGGAAFYDGEAFPEWEGNLLVSGLGGKHLARLVIEDNRVVGEERLLTDQNQRIRDVQVAADGSVWVVTDEDNGRLIRIAPAG
ncbi:PQQ-dependent sugar dehydrogenase [Brevundimonas aveniformis]|uniref:PQQ-dependent sugar dehydrogenase n=1 Tax=Brevundimonas aveniformis TaxID=370977 RepID=UPI0004237756|nr:PQQ-dependent sugar dehydrogenase [Brevundimonas aveniformis]